MAVQPHLKLKSSLQKEDPVAMNFNYGFGSDDQEAKPEPNYEPMVERFRGSLVRLNTDIENRHEERNEELEIPAHYDFIRIRFQDQFNLGEYQRWYNTFGLAGVHFSEFNREGLFAIVDEELFQAFLVGVEDFIARESGEENREYPARIRFIRDFKLLTTAEILSYQERTPLMFFQLIDFPVGSPESFAIYQRLEAYLQENAYDFRLVEEGSVLEVHDASQDRIEEIARNFDIILSITSSLATVVRPSELNTVERDYGFEINNSDDELPIIGILDTGISKETPLESILLEDERFNLTESSSFIDNANDGYGHGTSVAALAALGREPYLTNFQGEYSAHAKLLSMKILDANSGFLSISEIINLLEGAKQEYPEIKIFVLTTCFPTPKSTNEGFSSYAYKLDRFAHENDSLIFICTANNNNASTQLEYDLNYFSEEDTNLCTPAESMNNVVVGAAADNLRTGVFEGISDGREFPALYSRKSHLDLSELLPSNKQNKQLFRPDVIDAGGDYEQSGFFIGVGESASIEVLSANPAFGFYKDSGTSFSTPLVANTAVQIQKKYPAISAQTIKALIINGASLQNIRFDDNLGPLQNKTVGNGIVKPLKSLNSSDNEITFVIEDKIRPDQMKVFPLNFPTYLTSGNLGKRIGLLKCTATLCFSFEPVMNNHLGYCPLQMAFSIFRNHSGTQILEKEEDIKSKLKSSWSQNNRWKQKPIPASNTQKISFSISERDLKDEELTFKLAIHCLVNSQLLGDTKKYAREHPFSMAITIEETLRDAKKTGKLYAEMSAINKVENITELEGDAGIEIELENE